MVVCGVVWCGVCTSEKEEVRRNAGVTRVERKSEPHLECGEKQDQGKVAGLAKTSREEQSQNKLARLASSPVGKSVRARIAKRTSSGVDARTAAYLRALIHRDKGPRVPGPRGALVRCSTAARPALIRPARRQIQRI